MIHWRVAAVALVAAALWAPVACGGGQSPPPAAPPSGSAAPAASSPAWDPEADAGADAQPRKKAARASAPRKRALPTITGGTVINTQVDSTGAALVLGGVATLRIPEDAVVGGATLHFAFAEESLKGGPGRVGQVFELGPALASKGRPFELELPLPPGASAQGFAISRMVTHGRNESLEWDIVAATRVDTGKTVVVLELSELRQAFVHLTSRAPPKK